MSKLRRFNQELDAASLKACRTDPEVSRVGADHVVAIPQRAFRQPGRTLRSEPVLSLMASVGHGAGDVRVRLYLWMWAISSTRGASDLPIKRSTGEWAVLLNVLPGERVSHGQTRSLAARRVARAQQWLVESRAAMRPRRGEMVLLDPACDGTRYEPWSPAELELRRDRRSEYEAAWGDSYDQRRAGDYWEDDPLEVPVALWANGTVSALSGPALVVLLVLLDYERRFEQHGEPLLPPKSRPYEYPLSTHVWRRGTDELRQYGCIRYHAGPVVFAATGTGAAGTRRRSMWRIDHARLEGTSRERYG